MSDHAMTLRIPEELYQELRKEAFEHEVTITSLVRQAIQDRDMGARYLRTQRRLAAPYWSITDQLNGVEWTTADEFDAQMIAADIEKRTKVGTNPIYVGARGSEEDR